MVEFLRLWAMYAALLGLLAVPVFAVARRRKKGRVAINFTIAALVVGALMAVTKYTSDSAVASCEAVGNTQCFDAGSTGFLVLFVLVFSLVAWLRAWNLRGR